MAGAVLVTSSASQVTDDDRSFYGPTGPPHLHQVRRRLRCRVRRARLRYERYDAGTSSQRADRVRHPCRTRQPHRRPALLRPRSNGEGFHWHPRGRREDRLQGSGVRRLLQPVAGSGARHARPARPARPELAHHARRHHQGHSGADQSGEDDRARVHHRAGALPAADGEGDAGLLAQDCGGVQSRRQGAQGRGDRLRVSQPLVRVREASRWEDGL